MKNKKSGKILLSSFFGFLKDQIDNDCLSMEDFEALVSVVENDLSLSGTSDDFARYFHKTPVAVRSILSRRLLPKPKRRVMHDFKAFVKVAPDSWFVARK